MIGPFLLERRERAARRLAAATRLKAASLTISQTRKHEYRYRDAVSIYAAARVALRRADLMLDLWNLGRRR